MEYIEYIQNGSSGSTSSLYQINLNYYPTLNTRARIKFNYPAVDGDGNLLFGTSKTRNKYWRFFTYGSDAIMAFDFPNDQWYTGDNRTTIPYTKGTDAVFEIGNRYLINETTSESHIGEPLTSFDNPHPLTLWINSNVATGTKIYWIEIYEGNTLMMDLRPVDNDGVIGLYDEVGQTFYPNSLSGELIGGPLLSSIVINPTSKIVKATGDTITVNVTTENSWVANPTDGSWYSLSETGGTGDTAITITVPSYTGATARQDTITFVDTTTTDERVFTLKQKKYSVGQPMYLGGDEITEFYLGGDPISEMYLGENLVYSSGPFEGLKATPKTISFYSNNLTTSIKIKSSESWSLTTPAWITASVSTGDTGETVVSLTATTQTATTTGSVEVVSTSYSASVSANYMIYQPVSYVYATTHNGYVQANHIDTGIEHTASTMTIEIEYYGLGNFSDRMVGYSTGDAGCSSDNNDFRLFGYQGGTFDYMNYRSAFGGGIYNGYHHFTIGDCFCYDNENNVYKCQSTAIGSIPSPNCHILVDVSYIKVKSVKIMDGNTVLFDGVAATLEGQAGIYDKVSGTLKYNSNVPMSYDA